MGPDTGEPAGIWGRGSAETAANRSARKSSQRRSHNVCCSSRGTDSKSAWSSGRERFADAGHVRVSQPTVLPTGVPPCSLRSGYASSVNSLAPPLYHTNFAPGPNKEKRKKEATEIRKIKNKIKEGREEKKKWTEQPQLEGDCSVHRAGALGCAEASSNSQAHLRQEGEGPCISCSRLFTGILDTPDCSVVFLLLLPPCLL